MGKAHALFNLGDESVHHVDVAWYACLGDQNRVDVCARLLDHFDHIAVHVVGVKPVDPNRDGFVGSSPVDVSQRLDYVAAGHFFVIGCNCVLKVQEHVVGSARCRFLEESGA